MRLKFFLEGHTVLPIACHIWEKSLIPSRADTEFNLVQAVNEYLNELGQSSNATLKDLKLNLYPLTTSTKLRPAQTGPSGASQETAYYNHNHIIPPEDIRVGYEDLVSSIGLSRGEIGDEPTDVSFTSFYEIGQAILIAAGSKHRDGNLKYPDLAKTLLEVKFLDDNEVDQVAPTDLIELGSKNPIPLARVDFMFDRDERGNEKLMACFDDPQEPGEDLTSFRVVEFDSSLSILINGAISVPTQFYEEIRENTSMDNPDVSTL